MAVEAFLVAWGALEGGFRTRLAHLGSAHGDDARARGACAAPLAGTTWVRQSDEPSAARAIVDAC